MQPMGVQYGWHDPVKTNRSNPQGHEATPVHKESTNVKIRGCMHAVMQSQAHLGVRQRPGDSQVLKQRYLHFQQVCTADRRVVSLSKVWMGCRPLTQAK